MTDFRNNRNGLSRTEERLDSENQRRVDGLSDKVSRLKSLAFDIETETKDSNKYLDDMGNDFESTQGLLGGTVNRLSHMVNANKGNRSYNWTHTIFLLDILPYNKGDRLNNLCANMGRI